MTPSPARRTRADRARVVLAVVALVLVSVVVLRRSAPPRHPAHTRVIEVAPWRQAWPAPAAPVEVVAAPTGSGDACTPAEPCSLVGARDHVRALLPTTDRDVVVLLRGGTYAMAATLELGAQDSGANGHRVAYRAEHPDDPAQRPVLSGGVAVEGWSETAPGSGVYRAAVDPALDTRQLYVDGARATRARGAQDPAGWGRNAVGFTAPDTTMASWPDVAGAEIVSFQEWKSLRCPVDRVDGRTVVMAQPCWKNANAGGRPTMTQVTWVENARELLDEPGEWYLDRAAHELLYVPRPGEDMRSASVVAASTETLVSISGSREAPAHDIALQGITFAYSSWLWPSSADGYPVVQAGWHTYGAEEPTDERRLQRVPGAVTVVYATGLRFEDDAFAHLGASGLDLRVGTQDVGVVGNRFEDLSGHGVEIGETDYFVDRPSLAADRLDRFDVEDNRIERVGVEYLDTVAVLVTYASNVSILHNEVAHLPYSGISVGWGWGTDSYARHNVIAYNHIHDVMRTLTDGGAIYTLSAQPESLIVGNFIHDQLHLNGALYLDEGTRDFTVARNVVARVPRWVHLWTPTIRDDLIVDNFADTDELMNEGTNITFDANDTGLGAGLGDDDGAWPAEARAVMAQAGLEPPYRDRLPPS